VTADRKENNRPVGCYETNFSSNRVHNRLRLGVSLRSVLGLLVVLGSGRAAAERAIVVELAGPQAFDAGELTAAVRVRVAPDGGRIQLRVSRSGDGVLVETRGATRSVVLGDRRGADAARLVALAASDLLFDDLAQSPTVEPRAPGFTIAALGTVAAGDSGSLAVATIDLTLPRGAWLATASLGAGQLIGAGVHASEGIVRLGGGRRIGWLDLTAGVTFVPISVSDGAGDLTMLVGGGVAARLRVPLAERVWLVIAAGADAFATRSEYTSNGTAVASTPWLAPWVALGVEVAP
jgi:hypothetical protein